TRFSRDWSSDVCSSDLCPRRGRRTRVAGKADGLRRSVETERRPGFGPRVVRRHRLVTQQTEHARGRVAFGFGLHPPQQRELACLDRKSVVEGKGGRTRG